MTFSVDFDLGYAFDVAAPFGDVFGLLSDVPAAARCFPNVSKLTGLGRGVYRWELERVGTAHLGIRPVYTSRYVAHQARGTVVWTPVDGAGNARVGGSWTVADRKTHTALELKLVAAVDVPLPGLMKAVVAPLVASEFRKLVEMSIESLVARFGGRA